LEQETKKAPWRIFDVGYKTLYSDFEDKGFL